MPTNEEVQYRGLVFQVAVPSPLRRTFDYLPPVSDGSGAANAQAGARVLVPFGRRKVVGVLLAIKKGSSLNKNRLKAVSTLLDTDPLFPPTLFTCLRWAANYYQHPIGDVFSTAMPARLRAGKPLKPEQTAWELVPPCTDKESANGSPEESAAARASLSRAARQKALLQFIETRCRETGSARNDDCRQAGFATVLFTQLQQKNLIRKVTQPAPVPRAFAALSANTSSPIRLNPEQHEAVAAIIAKGDEYKCFLLDGITGSGKTEVYMRAMQAQLARGKQCLVLVPEIGLTPQTISRFQRRFSCPVVSLHSGLSDTQRLQAWDQARDGSAGIVIGTRSAIFTPLANPGLIVVDEEHDSSFKQQDGFRYSARDLAVIRAREDKICIILGSATPSLESLHNARSNKFEYLQLRNRAGSAQPPTMEVVDISKDSLDGGFSESLLYKIQHHLDAGNQVLVFINRRGFAPVLNCQSCGWTGECDNCTAQLTVHANPPSLRCHHCGSIGQLPRTCPTCSSHNLTTFGIGTQKIESYLNKRFTSTAVLRIDRDSTRGKNKLAEMLEQVNSGEPCILLGTQMLAKGHHFPNITLVAIMDADAGLFSADFRGQEQMAQTILQVAGRSGRADRAGEVVIQSRHSAHATLQCIVRGSYADFAKMLLAERKITAMPPYSHLSLIRSEAGDLPTAVTFLQEVAAIAADLCASQQFSVEIQGPLPAPMEKRAGRFRMQLLLKCRHRGPLQNLLGLLLKAMETLKQPNKLRWSIDVDPQDLI